MFARFAFRGKNVLRAAVTVPFVLPTIVVGSAFLAIIGSRGVLGRTVLARRTRSGRSCSPTCSSTTRSSFEPSVVCGRISIRRSTTRRAHSGASRWRALREVTWPLLRPAVVSAAAIVFLFSFTSFGVILVLGGEQHATLEVAIKRATLDRLDLRTASVLALVQLAAVDRTARVSSWATNQAVGATTTAAGGRRRPSPASRRTLVPRRQPGGDGRRARHTDGRARRAFVAHRVGLRLRLLPGARRDAEGGGEVRASARRGSQLAGVRNGRDRDRAHHRRHRRVHRGRRGTPAQPRARRVRPAVDAAARDLGGHRRDSGS